jgi:PEP-CTERM motif
MASINGLRDAGYGGCGVLTGVRHWMGLPAIVAVALVCAGMPAHASLIINPTFGSSITSDPNAASIEGAINAGIGAIEADITSPKALSVTILFNEMSSGLGESETGVYTVSYFDYYNAFKAIATSASQLTALASLGLAPTSSSSGNPVNGNTDIEITSAEGRNLGFNTPGVVNGSFDSEITLNTSITFPPNSPSGSNYGLQSVATHEIDEALGIGGTGTTLDGTGSLTGPVGDLDLYRYSAPGVRSYSNTQSTSPLAYLSINGGATVLSYFSQTTGADFGDWLSNPIPAGFSAQVQDAFGQTNTNPSLSVNELTAFNAIGYQVVVPEPSTLAFSGLGLALGCYLVRRRRTTV